MSHWISPPGSRRERGWGRLRLAIAGLLVATVLGGCVVRVVYNQLDWLAIWFVQDYFDLDDAQEAQAKALIARTLTWHRSTQLPRYSLLTRSLLAGVGAPPDRQFIADRYAEIVELWDVLLRRICPDVAALLQTLSDEQVEDLFANLAEENEELAEDYSGRTADERREKQAKAIIRTFRRFTGRLNDTQEGLIHRNSADLHDLSADWLRRRATWQQQFRILLVGRKSDPQFAERLTNLMLDPNQFDPPGYRQLVLENQQQSFQLATAVLGSLSAAQAEHFRKTLTTYARDFDALVRGGE
jgi:hypothetical protein